MEKHNALRLLLDVPETEAIFGFDKYATILTEAIVGTDPHFTIGIFGKWGSGKTTLIKKLEATLKSGYPNKVIPVFLTHGGTSVRNICSCHFWILYQSA